MNDVTLTIWSNGQTSTVPMQGSRVIIGRGESADIRLDDSGLSRLHASINSDGQRAWVMDEGSTNGTFVNGKRASAQGTALQDGDQITIGDTTKIKYNVALATAPVAASTTGAVAPPSNVSAAAISPLVLVGAASAVIIILTAVTAFALYWRGEKPKPVVVENNYIPSVEVATPLPTAAMSVEPIQQSSAPPFEEIKIDETADSSITPTALTTVKASEIKNTPINIGSTKLYKQMSEQEQVYFVYTKAKEVALIVGNRPAEFPDEAIEIIKFWVDGYVRRIGNGSNRLWAEDLNFMFHRARTTFVPQIIRAFKANNAPPAVGVYLPVIETEYRNITTENFAGAAGLFQFIGPTASGYGVHPSERTNIDKMAPAAARYINDNLKAFGADAIGVGLSIAGYNRSPDSVRRDLHDVIDSKNPDRDFWILVKNKSKLDHWFQRENINYVPRFFAAAIIGENPWNFGLKMRALTSYTEAPKENE
jgi:pSer/pThr/pTyr-binding forkhead associated (FHA) protein